MLNAVAGCILGFLSGLGVGGGSLLLLWLTLVQGVAQPEARLINLMFFLPCALIATFFRRRQGTFSWNVILPAAAAGILGAYLGSLLGGYLDTGMLKKAFGVLFILCGIRELLYKGR